MLYTFRVCSSNNILCRLFPLTNGVTRAILLLPTATIPSRELKLGCCTRLDNAADIQTSVTETQKYILLQIFHFFRSKSCLNGNYFCSNNTPTPRCPVYSSKPTFANYIHKMQFKWICTKVVSSVLWAGVQMHTSHTETY